MSLSMGSLKYEIDKITRLTSSTKRLPLFAYLFEAMINTAIDLNPGTKDTDRKDNLETIAAFCGQETVQTLFIILYPLYKNICLLTGRDPKDVALLLAKAIVALNHFSNDKSKSFGLDLAVPPGKNVSTRLISLILQGMVTEDRKDYPVLPTVKKFLEEIRFLEESMKAEFPPKATAAAASERVVGFAALSILALAMFMNLSARGRFQNADDESKAASSVLRSLVVAFRDSGIYDRPDFQSERKTIMKSRASYKV